MTTKTIAVEFDATGKEVYPDRCSHTFGYDGSGRLSTDTMTDGTDTWVKSYTYNGTGQLTGMSLWVKQ